MPAHRTRPIAALPPRPGEAPPLTPPEAVAILACILWAAAGLLWLALSGGSAAGAMAALVPPALGALAVAVSRAVRLLGHESARLAHGVATLAAHLAEGRATAPPAPGPAPAPLTVPPPAQTPRPAPAAPAPLPGAALIEDEPRLALGTDEEAPPIDRATLTRALHFPQDDRDAQGFAALRLALRDRRARALIQAAQDVLTLLSQEGIYMDDLTPDRARPEIWRRFAGGERGRAVAQLGGIHDRSCLALTMSRMREDMVFRDTAHHFLRLFDRMLAEIEPGATDAEIAALAETRTARAFMLLGRVTGAFD
ncbi:MAG: hypothetical protein IT542_12920 [Rubellimicrobium sp.]|nr:hypothetical protein [Rubellimicrobium sp.]